MEFEKEISQLNQKTRDIDKLIRDIHKNLVQYTKQNLKQNGLTMPRFTVLWHITKAQPVNMSYLHKKMYIANSTLTIIVDKLVEEGLVKRYRNPDDRRVVLLELTKDGDELLCKMLALRQSFLEKALQDLDSNEQEALINLLGSILSNLQNDVKQGNNIDE
ncbi:MAG: MarR family transcriptional regulator [Clostridiales bacterium]|nr:MarR family transcriptional regulator [Clostridiales bacterium]